MKQKLIFIIALVACVMMLTIPVQAETLTGTITGSNYTQSTFEMGGSGGGHIINGLSIKDIEYTEGFSSLVLFADRVWAYDAGAPPGQSQSFTANISDGTVIGTGTIGYQRNFLSYAPYTEQNGYFWLYMDTWNITGLSGNKMVTLNIAGTLYNCTSDYTYGNGIVGYPSGTIAFNRDGTQSTTSNSAGSHIPYQITKSSAFVNDYSVTKPGGIGIIGSIVKNDYSTAAFIFNATDNSVLASEPTVNTTNFNFTTTAKSIYIGIKDTSNNFWNTTVLFSVAPTTTPTVTPTIPGGYVRTYFENVDGMTTGQVHGSNLQLKDVEGGTWTNYTADLDGNGYIDTLPSHTINAYGDATGYTAVSRLGLPAFSEGVYSLVMYTSGSMPVAPAGTVNLVVLVHDWDTGQPLPGTQLTAVFPNGSSRGATTGDAGQHVFTVPNSSVISVTAQKAGYLTATQSIVTSASGMDSLWMKISTKTVIPTPTRTVVPGEVTVRPTIDPLSPEENNGDTSLKAQEMMNYLANNGLQVVEICFMVTILALLGVRLGK